MNGGLLLAEGEQGRRTVEWTKSSVDHQATPCPAPPCSFKERAPMAQRHVEAYTGAHPPAWKHRFPPHGSTACRQQTVAVAALLSRILETCCTHAAQPGLAGGGDIYTTI